MDDLFRNLANKAKEMGIDPDLVDKVKGDLESNINDDGRSDLLPRAQVKKEQPDRDYPKQEAKEKKKKKENILNYEDIIQEQLDLLEEYTLYNLHKAKSARIRYWIFKLPALFFAASTAAFEAFGFDTVVIIMGIVSSICIGIDAAWPGGILHNVHRRAANETRRLQQNVLTEWRTAQAKSINNENKPNDEVEKILQLVKKERNRIDKNVTNAEASLGKGASD